ncbi:MAG TPA: hypothetical protein VIT91_20165, partial [Chthoniobacterales bacterium]
FESVLFLLVLVLVPRPRGAAVLPRTSRRTKDENDLRPFTKVELIITFHKLMNRQRREDAKLGQQRLLLGVFLLIGGGT